MIETFLTPWTMIQMSLSLQGQRWSRFDVKARLPFKMAQGTVKGTIVVSRSAILPSRSITVIVDSLSTMFVNLSLVA